MLLRLSVVLAAIVLAGCSGDASPTVSESSAGSTTPSVPAVEQSATRTPSSVPSTTTTEPAPSTTRPATCTRIAEFDDSDWVIVNDGVMGGRSVGAGFLDDGVLVFEGEIVTAGGGFSSVRGPIDGDLAGATELRMRIRTDGRQYELLADDAVPGRQRVTHYRPVVAPDGNDWQEVTVPLVEMEARVFGNPVTADPFAPDLATSIGVILADGLDGPFRFELDWIDACR